MPGSRHAEQHPDRFSGQRRSWGDRLPAGWRRKKALRYGSIALAAAVCLLVVVPTAIRAVNSSAKHTAAQSLLNCSSSRRVASAPRMTTLLGVNATGSSQLAAATTRFGHMPVIRVYYAGVPTPSEWTTGATGINKSSVVISFRPTPAQVLSGVDDAKLAAFFDSAPRGHAIYYSFYAEPESHVKDGEFTLAQFKQAWSRVVAIADAAHNPYLHSILILQGQDARPSDEYNFKDYLPSNGIISAIGWDSYPAGTVDDQDPRPIPPAQFMGPDIAAARSVCLPFGIAEFALGTAASRPHWLAQVASYMQNNGALFGILFESARFPSMVLHDSASIQTWRTEVARSANAAPISP
jgi:hypothetical protein